MIFLHSYLAERRARVIVEGEHSHFFEIANQVFQGSVLGPALWNIFFESVDIPIYSAGAHSAKFADDLSVFRNFELL